MGRLIYVLCAGRCRRLAKVYCGVSRLLARRCENESRTCNKWRFLRFESGWFKTGRQEGCILKCVCLRECVCAQCVCVEFPDQFIASILHLNQTVSEAFAVMYWIYLKRVCWLMCEKSHFTQVDQEPIKKAEKKVQYFRLFRKPCSAKWRAVVHSNIRLMHSRQTHTHAFKMSCLQRNGWLLSAQLQRSLQVPHLFYLVCCAESSAAWHCIIVLAGNKSEHLSCIMPVQHKPEISKLLTEN